MQKRLILVAGAPATGKSAFARRLSEALQIPYYSKDHLNEIAGEHMTFSCLEERQKLSVASVHVLLYIADRLLSTHQPVILESNFKLAEIETVRALIDRHACQTLTFVLQGDMPVVYERFMRREMSGERKAIHKYHGLTSLALFTEAVAPLSEFDVGGIRLCVDTTDFDRVDNAGLVRAAERFMRG